MSDIYITEPDSLTVKCLSLSEAIDLVKQRLSDVFGGEYVMVGNVEVAELPATYQSTVHSFTLVHKDYYGLWSIKEAILLGMDISFYTRRADRSGYSTELYDKLSAKLNKDVVDYFFVRGLNVGAEFGRCSYIITLGIVVKDDKPDRDKPNTH